MSELSKLNVHHRILSNLYLPNGKGTTEVDIVMITLTGIYVIESKNYKGWIFGRETDKNWTQSFPKNKFKFYNPVKQNEGHIRALHSTLRRNKIHEKDYPYVSYIVFGNDCELKSINVDSAKVINLRDLCREIKVDIASKDNLFAVSQVNKIYNFLNQYANASERTKLKHKQYVESFK